MDDRGYWHNIDPAERERQARAIEGAVTGQRFRPVLSAAIGSHVKVRLEDGCEFEATFYGAQKNRVTLKPMDNAPYLDFGSVVTLVTDDGEAKANVWDNRGGKVILRTLPL